MSHESGAARTFSRRFSQWLTHFPRLATLCLAWLPFALIYLLGRQGMSYYQYNEAQRLLSIESAAMHKDAEGTALNLARSYHLLNDLPEALATSHDVRALLTGEQDALQTNRWLKLLTQRSEPDLIWVLNKQGIAVASSNYAEEQSLIGTDYSDREYFTAAMQTQQGRQFAVGRQTNTPGLYFSSQVRNSDGALGVVATRLTSTQLQQLLRGLQGFISDELGVVIIANDPSLAYLRLTDAPAKQLSSAALLARYKRDTFMPLPFSPVEFMGHTLWQRNDRPGEHYLWVSHTDPYTNMTVHITSDLPTLKRLTEGIARLNVWLLLLSFLLAWALTAALIYRLKTLQQAYNLTLSNQALERLNQELLEQASRDYLTGIANRRRFSLTLPHEIERSRRYQRPLCLAVIDLDHFKQLNDRYGHAAGDAALCHATTLLNSALRQSDLLARIGGEEFGLILPETSLSGAETFIDRLRTQLESQPLSFEGQTINITLSAGIAQLSSSDLHADSLFSRADQALYRAKQQGRNQVATASTMN